MPPSKTSRKISLPTCRYRLTVIWFGGFFLISFIVVLQQAMNYYGGDAEMAWAWLLPNTVPTLSLMVGVLVAAQRSKPTRRETVDRSFYRLTLTISLIYLFLLLFTLLIQPVSPLEPLALMEGSRLYLTPFQGLATGMLGAFFISRDEDDEDEDG